MLKPSMNELMKRVGNRYLLVNLAAQRARDISQESEENGDSLSDKAVKLALDEIAAGTIHYRPGPKVEKPEHTLRGGLDIDLDYDDSHLDEDQDETQDADVGAEDVEDVLDADDMAEDDIL